MGNVNSYIWPDVGVPGVVVKTALGSVRGKTITIDDGRKVHAFLGIPYAQAPTGELRFQKPIPIEAWDNVKDCTKFGPRAVQADMVWDRFIVPVPKSEDCLHLNVFVPEWESESQRTVLVFIHGGGFAIHSTANYGDKGICRNICRHDVIVVTIQYRLGLLGFLSTGDENCPGNLGLWDQTLAVKWVKENIDSFGGNPDNITVFGQSAGAAGADMLSISPHSRDLFHKVILMGGNAECDWTIVKPESGLKIAESIAVKNGWKCENDVPRAERHRSLVEFLRVLPTQHLEIGLWGCSGFNRKEKGLKFCPVIDGDFLPEPVHVLRQKAPKKICMVGTAEYEALLFVALGKPQCNLISIDKMLTATIPSDDHETVTQARRLYLSTKDLSCKTSVARSFVALFSDLMMNNGTQEYCREMTSFGHDVYLYSFDYHSEHSFGFLSYRMPFKAATHCYDLRFLFGKGLFSKFSPDSDDLRMIDIMTSYWTCFAKTGNPNGCDPGQIWQKITPDDTYRYLSISLRPQFKPDYHDRRAEFWKTMLDRMKAVFILAALVVSCLSESEQAYSDAVVWTTVDIDSNEAIDDRLNTESAFFIYTFPDFGVELLPSYDKDVEWKTPLLRDIKDSKHHNTGVVFTVIEVNKNSNTVIRAVNNWDELEAAFAEDQRALNGEPYSAYIIKPEFTRYVHHRVKRVSINMEPKKQGRRKNQKSRVRTQNRGEEFTFPIALPPYHKNERYPVAKENPENFGNCLLYLEGVDVIVYGSDKSPNYIATLVGRSDNHKYLFNDDDVQCVPSSRNSTKTADVRGEYSFDVTIKADPAGVVGKHETVPQFKVTDTIRFKLIFTTTLPGYWELTKVELSDITVAPVRGGTFVREKMSVDQTISAEPKFMEMYSTDPYGYGCSTTKAVFFPLGEDGKTKYQVGIGFHNIQVQLYGTYRNEQKDEIKFSNNVNDCVPTISPGSAMGIIVTLVLCSILIFAFLMLNSVKTQDRFDDPKQKQIVINVRE